MISKVDAEQIKMMKEEIDRIEKLPNRITTNQFALLCIATRMLETITEE